MRQAVKPPRRPRSPDGSRVSDWMRPVNGVWLRPDTGPRPAASYRCARRNAVRADYRAQRRVAA